MARSVEAGGPKKGKIMPTKRLGGEVTIIPAGAAKQILKMAITKALAKKQAEGVSAKALAKAILDAPAVKNSPIKQKDIAKELYNFYKKNPKVDTSVKVSAQTTRVNSKDVVAARLAARAERVRNGISPERAAKPKLKGAASTISDKQKAMAAAAKKMRKEETIEMREPAPNPERPARSELAAFAELSKFEKANYNQVEKQISEAIKKIRQAERGKTPAKNSPTRGKTAK